MARIQPLIIVIKLGTSSIVHETTHQPLLSLLSSIVETVVRLRSQGHKVVLVSSGAIGVGLQRMGLPCRPKSLSGKQALAAIGQGRLIALWDNLFSMFEQPIAQVLLTRGDISDRTRYLNAVNTFNELLSMGVLPIVNENDTVSVSEIKFGDNDTLSAITSSMIQADYLFLLTDVDGLYTSNPRKDPDAKKIEVVNSISEIRAKVSTTTLGSSLGTGGMETKIIAAEIATAAGVATIITSGKRPEIIFSIIEYHTQPAPSRKASSDQGSSLMSESPSPNGTMSSPPLARPPHTLFTPSPTQLRDLKSWTRYTLFPAGSVVIDEGAYHALTKKESGGRLLAAGVVGVIGAFASGQAVRIVIRQQSKTARKEDGEKGDAERAEDEKTKLGKPSNNPPSVEITSLSLANGNGAELASNAKQSPLLDRISEDYVEEVGRGLANYNSAQIATVKGMNSSQLPSILGYADSEYVVENITILPVPS